jgi:hypothetical protein
MPMLRKINMINKMLTVGLLGLLLATGATTPPSAFVQTVGTNGGTGGHGRKWWSGWKWRY